MVEANSVPTQKSILGRVLLLALVVAVLSVGGWKFLRQAEKSPSPHPVPAAKSPANRAEIRIQGMDCLMCAAGLQNHLRALRGVSRAEVNYQEQLAIIEFDPVQTGPEKFVKAIEENGFKVIPPPAPGVRSASPGR